MSEFLHNNFDFRNMTQVRRDSRRAPRPPLFLDTNSNQWQAAHYSRMVQCRSVFLHKSVLLLAECMAIESFVFRSTWLWVTPFRNQLAEHSLDCTFDNLRLISVVTEWSCSMRCFMSSLFTLLSREPFPLQMYFSQGCPPWE